MKNRPPPPRKACRFNGWWRAFAERNGADSITEQENQRMLADYFIVKVKSEGGAS